jgi:hypothetical protein
MSNILDKVQVDLQRQELKGLNKYGGTLDKPFSELETLKHAYEEALDLCMYLAKTIDTYEQRRTESGDSEAGSGISNTIPTT